MEDLIADIEDMNEEEFGFAEKVEELIERFCKPALHLYDEEKVKSMKLCLTLIGEL